MYNCFFYIIVLKKIHFFSKSLTMRKNKNICLITDLYKLKSFEILEPSEIEQKLF